MDGGWWPWMRSPFAQLLPSSPQLTQLMLQGLGPAGRYGTEGDPVSFLEMHFSNRDMLSPYFKRSGKNTATSQTSLNNPKINMTLILMHKHPEPWDLLLRPSHHWAPHQILQPLSCAQAQTTAHVPTYEAAADQTNPSARFPPCSAACSTQAFAAVLGNQLFLSPTESPK